MSIQMSLSKAVLHLHMHLGARSDAQTSATLLSLTLGFVLGVVALHAGELLILALRGRWWWLAVLGAAGCLGILILVLQVGQQALQARALPLTDVLGLLGVQSAALICLTPRLVAHRLRRYVLARREQQWHLQHQNVYRYPTPTPTTPSQRLRERLAERLGRARRS